MKASWSEGGIEKGCDRVIVFFSLRRRWGVCRCFRNNRDPMERILEKRRSYLATQWGFLVQDFFEVRPCIVP